MSNDIKVSVIVPVYNTEEHLRQCLDSIAAQTLREIEILCVDDGSTDSSPQILEEYAARDGRFQIYHQENQFAGAARNNGMSHAAGKYLVFWDSDDFFEPEALEKMYAKCEEDEADICVCGANRFLESRKIAAPFTPYLNMKRVPDIIPFNIRTNPDYILNFTCEAAWNKMFLRSFAQEHQIEFSHWRIAEDAGFTERALCLADRITIVNEQLVNYRKDQKEGTMSTLVKTPLEPYYAWEEIRRNLIRDNCFPEKSYINRVLTTIFAMTRNTAVSWDAFASASDYLRSGGLDLLGIREMPSEDYYADWHEECLRTLIHGTNEEFLCSVFTATCRQLTNSDASRQAGAVKNKKHKLKIASLKEKNAALKETCRKLTDETGAQKAELRSLRSEKQAAEKRAEKLLRENEKIRASWSFRIGKVIVWLPGKIKRLFRRGK